MPGWRISISKSAFYVLLERETKPAWCRSVEKHAKRWQPTSPSSGQNWSSRVAAAKFFCPSEAAISPPGVIAEGIRDYRCTSLRLNPYLASSIQHRHL